MEEIGAKIFELQAALLKAGLSAQIDFVFSRDDIIQMHILMEKSGFRHRSPGRGFDEYTIVGRKIYEREDLEMSKRNVEVYVRNGGERFKIEKMTPCERKENETDVEKSKPDPLAKFPQEEIEGMERFLDAVRRQKSRNAKDADCVGTERDALNKTLDRRFATICHQKDLIAKLIELIPHDEACSTVGRHDETQVPCTCGREAKIFEVVGKL